MTSSYFLFLSASAAETIAIHKLRKNAFERSLLYEVFNCVGGETHCSKVVVQTNLPKLEGI